jgi:hypothetical protein
VFNLFLKLDLKQKNPLAGLCLSAGKRVRQFFDFSFGIVSTDIPSSGTTYTHKAHAGAHEVSAQESGNDIFPTYCHCCSPLLLILWKW